MKNNLFTITEKEAENLKDVDLIYELGAAVESGEKERILAAYDLIEKSDIDFSKSESFMQEAYDEYVSKGNLILGI